MSEAAGIGPDRAAVSWAVARLWHRDGKWANVRLEGISMHPLIQDGALLRVRFGTFQPADLKVGDLVVYSPREAAPEGEEGSLPSRRLIAHRVVRIGRRGPRAGLVYVKGDPLSTWRASWIRVSEILGRVAAVTQPDGRRLHLNTPAGRALARCAAWVSRSLGLVDAHLPRRPTDPMHSLTGQSLSLLRRGYDAAARRFEQAQEPVGSWVLSAEERFIVAACRPWLSADDAARLRARAADVLDWDQVRAQAVALGLAPLMFRNLSDPRAQHLCPAGFMEKVGRASHVSAYLTMQRREQLVRVLNSLQGAGIEPVLLKGAALANTVYDDPALRTMNDLDLLVRPSEIQAASAALTALAYRELYRAALADPGRRNAFYGAHHHATPLMEPRGRAVVELHRHIVTMKGAGAYDVERIRARARRVTLPGLRGLVRPEVLVPCPADMVLHTCLHLSYADRFVGKLRDLIDLHETVRRYGPDIDWGLILAEVPNEAIARCLFSCLDLARRLYGTPVPEDFLHELRRHAKMGPVGSGVLRALACAALFNSASSRTVLTAATVRWCCDTLLRRGGWTARLKALASLLAEG